MPALEHRSEFPFISLSGWLFFPSGRTSISEQYFSLDPSQVGDKLADPCRNAGQRLENVGRTAQRAPLRDVLRHARQSHGGDPAPVGGQGEGPARRLQVGQ